MNDPSSREEIIEQLRNRMGEVAEHRAVRWLEELENRFLQSPKERLMKRLVEAPDELLAQWLKELNDRLSWVRYRKEHAEFCYGVAFGEHERCKPSEKQETCPDTSLCKEEYEAEWSEKK